MKEILKEIDELKKGQDKLKKEIVMKEILKEIDELKKGQDKLKKEITNLKSAAPANSNKGVAAKGGKKNVPIGNSMVLGKADAPVTITKWTDFQ